jgi:hypothetical protein
MTFALIDRRGYLVKASRCVAVDVNSSDHVGLRRVTA